MSRIHRIQRSYQRVSNFRWTELRNRALERDGFRCVKCSIPGRLEVDHIVPKSNGGSDDLSNLQTLCRSCHIAKTKAENGYRPRYQPGFASLIEEMTK